MRRPYPLPKEWQAPLSEVVLSHDEVHVWAIRISEFSSFAASLELLLSPEEHIRYEQFYRYPEDRLRYVISHGMARVLLGQYLVIAPSQVPISYLPYGKPVLQRLSQAGRLEFNISHSADLVLLAAAREYAVGIDVEYCWADPGWQKVAETFFAHGELLALQTLPHSKRLAAFFTCWTRKEAYCKARGFGLQVPLDQYEVSVDPDQPALLLQDKWDPDASANWTLTSLNAGTDYVAALAVRTRGKRVPTRLWTAQPLQHQRDVCSTVGWRLGNV